MNLGEHYQGHKAWRELVDELRAAGAEVRARRDAELAELAERFAAEVAEGPEVTTPETLDGGGTGG